MGYYVLVFLFGLVGAATVLRGLEVLVFGHSFRFMFFIVGFGSLYLAMRFLRKARESSS